jgi:phospholipid-transporting ATPase
MEHPNKLIDSFSGVLDLGPERGREPLQPTNILLRGCTLRNSEWAIGIVVNTGHETKIMMSSVATKAKTSSLESFASLQIQRIIILLALLCFIGTTGQAIWDGDNEASTIWYLDWSSLSAGSFWFVEFFYFFLLHATFIPVSLYVSMSITRFFQSYMMNNNLEMYYAPIDAPALVRTMTLNEELGQITHIFTDKTGTLTRNRMDFRKCSINGVSYGQGITEIGKSSWLLQGQDVPDEVLRGERLAQENKMPHVSFWCPKYEEHVEDSHKSSKIREFFRAIAICHDVIVEKVDDELKLSASNPDDEALVFAAEYFGYKFCDRRGNVCVLNKRKRQSRGVSRAASSRQMSTSSNTSTSSSSDDWEREEVVVLDSIEFTSKRKRMSVIIQEADGSIRLLCKGADTAVLPRLSKAADAAGGKGILQETINHCREFAMEGLRTLLIGYTEISADQYATWKKYDFSHCMYRYLKHSFLYTVSTNAPVPMLMKSRSGSEARRMTLKSLKTKLSQTLFCLEPPLLRINCRMEYPNALHS